MSSLLSPVPIDRACLIRRIQNILSPIKCANFAYHIIYIYIYIRKHGTCGSYAAIRIGLLGMLHLANCLYFVNKKNNYKQILRAPF